MSDSDFTQSSFLSGEFSPYAQGRTDIPQYRQALNVCRNGLPLEEGAWARRSGTRFWGWTRNALAAKIIPFVFEESSPYQTEFTSTGAGGSTNGYLRFQTYAQQLSGALPSDYRLVTTNDEQVVVSISTANPAVLQTTTNHGWNTGDQVIFLFNGSTPQLSGFFQNWQFTITVTSANQFSLNNAITGVTLDGSTIPALSGTVTVARLLTISGLPYGASDIQNIRTVQAETVNMILNGNYPPHILSVASLPTTNNYATFTMQDISTVPGLCFQDGPYFDPPTDGTLLYPNYVTPLTTAQVAALTTTQVQALTIPQIATLTTADINTFTTTQIQALTTDQIPALSNTDITALTTTQLRAFTTTQISAFTLKDVESLTTTQVNNLTVSQGIALVNATNAGALGNLTVGTLTASSIASINSGTGFQATDVGRMIRAFSQPPNYNPITTYPVGQSVTYNGAYFTCIKSGVNQEPDISVNYWSINTSAAGWAWGIIQSVQSTSAITVEWLGGTSLIYPTTQIGLWSLGLYSNTTGWPTCGLYYQGRIFLAGAQPNRIDASEPNQISPTVSGSYPQISFSPTAVDGTVADSNGISYTFDTNDLNPIYWLKEVSTGILCGTLPGEWLIPSNPGSPLSPSNFSASRVTTYGCENIEPVHTELTTCFVQRYGRKVLESFQDVFSGRTVAQNLAEYSKHLTASGVAEIRYQQEYMPVIWARKNDGTLAGATYKRDSLFSSQPAKFVGWHRHDLGSGAPVSSIAIFPALSGQLDTLSMVTEVNGYYQIELMNNIFDVEDSMVNGWFLDDAIVPSGGTTTPLLEFTNNTGQNLQFQNNSGQNLYFNPSGGTGAYTVTLYGLNHLDGLTVSASIGGLDCGDAYIVNGQATFDMGYTNLVTPAFLASISSNSAYGALGCPITIGSNTYTVPVVVGFNYTSQGQVLRPDTIDQVRNPTGPGSGKVRRNHQFSAFMQNTQGISFGTNFSTMHVANFKSPGGTPYALSQLWNGVFWDTLNDTYSFDGMLCWQITRPYPATIMSVTQFLQTQDR